MDASLIGSNLLSGPGRRSSIPARIAPRLRRDKCWPSKVSLHIVYEPKVREVVPLINLMQRNTADRRRSAGALERTTSVVHLGVLWVLNQVSHA